MKKKKQVAPLGTHSGERKIAIIHDWLTGMRGGEKVLEAILDIYPDSEIFTLLHNPGSVSAKIEQRPIHTSFINRLPGKTNRYRHYLPLFPTAIELFNLKAFDLILSTSHCVAKGVVTPPNALHIAYLHTPMRYVWDMYDEYFGPGQTGWLSGKLIPLFANYLRTWDVTSSNRVDWFLANSGHVARRIRKYYRREATVIHPPVDIHQFQLVENNQGYYLIVSALVPYKKVDLAIQAFNRLKQRLVVVGKGPELPRLQKMAGSTIEFVDWQSPEKLQDYYAGCKALIFPGEEDFGIVPVEAMACGKPVIAFARGGARETVLPAQPPHQPGTGIFFFQQTVDALIQAIRQSETIPWQAQFIRKHAEQFSVERFKHQYREFVESKWEQFSQRTEA